MGVLSPVELLHQLEARGVTLTCDQDGRVHCLAPTGVLTPALRWRMRVYKQALLALLQARAPTADAAVPQPEASMYRRWVPGETAGQFGTFKLEIPKYHDTPSAPVTYWGELCTKKACQKQAPGATRSLRYFPSVMCVSCWERADKRV